MLFSAFLIAVLRLHVRWINRRYEYSRWMLFSSLTLLAVHFFLQMCFGFRASREEVGAVINILVYLPSFTLFAMAIYNIEATHTNRRKRTWSVLPYMPPCLPSLARATMLPAP